MLIDLEEVQRSDERVYDVCVVGAGAAGIPLAMELANQQKSVLLLEGGGRSWEARSQSLYDGKVTGAPFTGFRDGRLRALGGTTVEWGGQILELDESDFLPRDWIPGSGWPITREEIAPYYRKARQLEGLENCPDTTDAIWRNLGLQELKLGGELDSAFSLWCPNPNLVDVHKEKILRNERITVYIHANVVRLNFPHGSESASSIVCRTLAGQEHEFSARKFVFCMGTIEVCRFLLQPPGNSESLPWMTNRLIGQHFNEHVSCFAADIEDLKISPVRGYFDYVFAAGYKYHHKMKLPRRVQAERKTLNACGTVAFVVGTEDVIERAYRVFRLLRKRRFSEVTAGDIVHFVQYMPALAWHIVPYHITSWRRARVSSARLKLCVTCEQEPLSQSRIGLSEQRDALGLYLPCVDWRISETEIETIRQYVHVAEREFRENGIGTVKIDPKLEAGDSDFIAQCRECYHHMGGTRMAISAEKGVVDRNLRVFGTTNTYICSCSVFPCSGFANPTHTLIALATRLAAHLGSSSA